MKPKAEWFLLSFLALIATAVVLIPAWIIQPFRSQTTSGVEVSYVLRESSRVITLIALPVVLLFSFRLWRKTTSKFGKTGIMIVMLLTSSAAWFSWQNHFEWMFNPLPNPSYVNVKGADFITEKDMVMAVSIKGDAVAYPIRLVAYHHLVHDVIGGIPVVATY
jgi:Protein of unknown function (DUF3179)